MPAYAVFRSLLVSLRKPQALYRGFGRYSEAKIHPCSGLGSVLLYHMTLPYLHFRYWSDIYGTSERREQIRVGRVVIVRGAVTVDITKVRGVTGIRRTLPPVVGAASSTVPI